MTAIQTHAHPMPTHKLSAKKIVAIILLILVVGGVVYVHTYFKSWLLNYVNGVLNDMGGYHGHVADIEIDLYRGAYQLKHVTIVKKSGKVQEPFVRIADADFSVEWKALLHKRVVAQITFLDPQINFDVAPADKQYGNGVDWTERVKQLAPIDINSIKIENGNLNYKDFSTTPKVDVFIHHINGDVQNLRNVEAKGNKLPSPIHMEGSTIGNGHIAIDGTMNILKQTPDMNLKLAMDKVNLPALNSYSEAYADFDFKSGSFSTYAELKVINNKVSGYIKPIATDLTVDVLKSSNPIEVVWRAAVAAVLQVFTNLPHDQFATRVDLDGSLDKIDTDTWSAIFGIFRNAFIQAMSKGFDQKDQTYSKPQ